MLILPEPAPAANFPTIPCALLLNKHTLNLVRRYGGRVCTMHTSTANFMTIPLRIQQAYP